MQNSKNLNGNKGVINGRTIQRYEQLNRHFINLTRQLKIEARHAGLVHYQREVKARWKRRSLRFALQADRFVGWNW